MAEQGETTRHGAKAPPCAMVIFGATGDLTARLLMPAIYNLSRSGLLSDNFALVGLGRSEQSDEAFRKDLTDAVQRFVKDTAMGGSATPFDAKAWDFIASRTTYLGGDLTKPDIYKTLGEHLGKLE